jgi:HAD superfamily hydrolase (TIGR01509 family)
MQGIIFDFDGTIIDTEWPEVESWQAIFGEYGLEFPDEAWKATIGRGADQEAERPADMLAQKLGHPEMAHELAVRNKDLRIELIERQPVLPGVIGLLDEIQAAGLRLAIASSSDHAWVEGHLTRLGLKDRFEFFCCREDVPSTKPDPALYLLALEKLGLAARNVAAIEDSPSGTTSAQTAGIYTVVVPNPLTSQLDLSHADWLVPSLENVSLKEIEARVAARS